MFRKILIIAMFGTAAGYCFAAQNKPQVVTSEVFYSQDKYVDEDVQVVEDFQETAFQEMPVPVWPLVGSEADVEVSCESGVCSKKKQSDNIKIVSKIGADLVVENNFNLGARGEFSGWSGGANMLHGMQAPMGFADECEGAGEMPLLTREMLEDDGGTVLSVSRSSRKNCGKYADSYAAFAQRAGIRTTVGPDGTVVSVAEADPENPDAVLGIISSEETEIAVDVSADAEAPVAVKDQVRSWVVANGQTLREVLQSWCDKEGWDLVWATAREYPIEASAVFKGRFVDVASALVRNFGRATPIPYAKFYKGNRVLVVSTGEE
jgi:hypothetical protein